MKTQAEAHTEAGGLADDFVVRSGRDREVLVRSGRYSTQGVLPRSMLAPTGISIWHDVVRSAFRALGVDSRPGTKGILGERGLIDRRTFVRSRAGFSLVGAGGIEPPNVGIKVRCLTAWLRPSDHQTNKAAADW
jgi:hypothetical protein